MSRISNSKKYTGKLTTGQEEFTVNLIFDEYGDRQNHLPATSGIGTS
jgi:hypothetical protein